MALKNGIIISSNLTTMKRGLYLVLLIAVIGCTDTSDEPLPLSLEGRWVDQLTTTDTLEFIRLEDGSTLMDLRRGREFRNGHDLPKAGAGLYLFSLSKNSISLRYSFSSFSEPTEYYFRQNALELKIGRFFESNNSAAILTFRKVK